MFVCCGYGLVVVTCLLLGAWFVCDVVVVLFVISGVADWGCVVLCLLFWLVIYLMVFCLVIVTLLAFDLAFALMLVVCLGCCLLVRCWCGGLV